MEHLHDFNSWDFKILATDLSNSAIKEAELATYPEKMIENLDRALARRYFEGGSGSNNGIVRVAKHIRDLVTVRRLNLMDYWPFKGPFDVIFCRNVMIYFDRSTREKLVNRMYDLLSPGGVLAIGSAETLSGFETQFRTVQPSVYVK